MKIKFIGDPREAKGFDPSNPESITRFGETFPLGIFVNVSKDFWGQYGPRFENHSHFKVMAGKHKEVEEEPEEEKVEEEIEEESEDSGNPNATEAPD